MNHCLNRGDAHRLPRPSAPRRARGDRGRALHRRERGALPRGGRASWGSPSSACPSTSTASARPRRLEAPFWRENAHDDLDAYCAFVREETDLRLGIEADFVPGAEDRMANLLEAHDFDYVIGSVHFLRDHGRHGDYSVWSRDPAPRRSGGATSRRSARPRAAACSTSSRTPTSSRSGVPTSTARGRSAALLRARARGDRRVGHRRGGLHGRAAQAAPARFTRRRRS